MLTKTGSLLIKQCCVLRTVICSMFKTRPLFCCSFCFKAVALLKLTSHGNNKQNPNGLEQIILDDLLLIKTLVNFTPAELVTIQKRSVAKRGKQGTYL